MSDSYQANTQELLFSSDDIYRAAEEGVFSRSDAEKLVQWGYEQQFNRRLLLPAPEHHKGFNLVTTCYYFGAMLMISACAWFLGDKWDELGSKGIFVTTLIYMTAAASLGVWLRNKGFVIGGGLLVTVVVTLIPLVTYTIEDMFGLWSKTILEDYERFYPITHVLCIVIEIATIAAAAFAIKFVRFGFLTAPMAVSFWFFAMNIACLIFETDSLPNTKIEWVSVIVGITTIVVGHVLEKTLKRDNHSCSEDFAFWCYLFGMFGFWGGLTSISSDSELILLLYAVINLGLIGTSLYLKRRLFLVFGRHTPLHCPFGLQHI
ncbi:MAG: hypothetical protein JNN15_04625 [Blastocatellia bacterium]|nr:hypothetical protein [Blastocatellia bacterium]